MYQKSPEPPFQKKVEDAIAEYGNFIVEEVLHVVEISGVDNAYTMFQEFEQYEHCQIIKQLYY
jgi:hypothetical protein